MDLKCLKIVEFSFCSGAGGPTDFLADEVLYNGGISTVL